MRKPRKPRVQRRRVYLCTDDPDSYIPSNNWADTPDIAIRRAVGSVSEAVIDQACLKVPDFTMRERVRDTLVAQHWIQMRKRGWVLLRGRLSFVIPRKRGT